MNEKIAVLVTTAHRGVFFGYAEPDAIGGKTITLVNCRNCISWSADIGGFLGLASVGPSKSCRIGSLAPLPVLLHDITSVSQVTSMAADAWMKA